MITGWAHGTWGREQPSRPSPLSRGVLCLTLALAGWGALGGLVLGALSLVHALAGAA